VKKYFRPTFLVLLLVCILGTAGWEGDGLVAGGESNMANPLQGTSWRAEEGFKKTIYHFKEKGILHYTTLTGTYRNGTWKQFGDAVFIETNKHFMNILGIINGKTIEGIAWNKHGQKWKVKFSKKN